jgi:TolA-binding protein
VVRSAAGSKTETAAMAQCLIGDSYLAQDNAATALREYLRVETVYPFPHWQATALLQAAKCQEQLGHSREAADLYARVRQNYQETEVMASVNKRSADSVRK